MDFSTHDFDVALEKYNFKVNVWVLPYKFTFEKISSGKYTIHITSKETDEEIMNTPTSHFELHYSEKEQMIGLFYKNKKKGWYINQEDVYTFDGLDTSISALIGKNYELMCSVYEKHELGIEEEEKNPEEIPKPTRPSDYFYTVKDGKVLIVGKKYFEVYADVREVDTAPIKDRMNELGFFYETNNLWIHDGRYVFEDMIVSELDSLGLKFSTILKQY